jgi:predicted nucleic acid-binding Zn finger protein
MTTTRSELFKSYNQFKKAARALGADTKRIDRGLGVAQRKDPRPYVTTTESCTCPDHTYRKVTCKHMIALQLKEMGADQPVGEPEPQEQPIPVRKTEAQLLAELGF